MHHSADHGQPDRQGHRSGQYALYLEGGAGAAAVGLCVAAVRHFVRPLCGGCVGGLRQEPAAGYVQPYSGIFLRQHRPLLHRRSGHPSDHRREQRAERLSDDHPHGGAFPLHADLLAGGGHRHRREAVRHFRYFHPRAGRGAVSGGLPRASHL